MDEPNQVALSARISGTNIQFIPKNIEDARTVSHAVHDYNSSVSSQFKIQLDILIYDPENLDIYALSKLRL